MPSSVRPLPNWSKQTRRKPYLNQQGKSPNLINLEVSTLPAVSVQIVVAPEECTLPTACARRAAASEETIIAIADARAAEIPRFTTLRIAAVQNAVLSAKPSGSPARLPHRTIAPSCLLFHRVELPFGDSPYTPNRKYKLILTLWYV